jgi:hypothetical protein
MMVLTTVLIDEDRKSLIAEWAGVTSEADYGRLMSRMEDLGKKYQVVLPPRRDK